ncbi:MAG: ABC transporter ATP-binding protein [bacterium]
MNRVLTVDKIRKEFGGLIAVKDVSFHVYEGHIQSLIGPNGAGKTTIFNLINRFFPLTGGQIYFYNQRIDSRRPHLLSFLGLTRTFQNVQLFPEMTVLENVMVGCHPRSCAGLLSSAFRLPRVSREEIAIKEKALLELNFIGLYEKANERAGDLPFGEQRILEIARGLATEPKLILLDEPAAGLNTHETESLAELIKQIKERGITVFMVEHDMGLVMDISDRVMVLNHGEKIAEGTPVEIQNNPLVISAYLGEEI